MSKSKKRKRIPEEYGNARELITTAIMPFTEFTATQVLPGTSGIYPIDIPKLGHVASHFHGLYSSLVISYDIQPPEGQDYIDVGDECPLTISVLNKFPSEMWPIRLLPNVLFKDIWIRVRGTINATVVNPAPDDMYALVTGDGRLEPGHTVEKEIILEIKAEVSGDVDPVERIANILVFADLDVEALFSYIKAIAAYTQVRPV